MKRRRPRSVVTKPVLRASLERGLDVAAHAGVAREVALDVRLRLGERMPSSLREPRGPHAVEDAEVDHLGDAPLSALTRAGSHVEHLGRGARVDVLAVAKRGDQRVVGARCASTRSSICE